MNKIYELLAKKSHLDKVEYGDEISIDVDLALAHDKSIIQVIKELNTINNNEKITRGDILHVTVDHFLPSPNVDSRENFNKIKKFCNYNNINLYSNGEGIIHQVIVENMGDNLKDKIIVGVDGHMATSAPLGCLPFSIRPKEMAKVLLSGKYIIKVPKVISIILDGETNLSGKDIALYIIKEIDGEVLKGKAIILSGRALSNISLSKKLTISNMLGEIGVRTCYFHKEYLHSDNTYYINLEDIRELVSLPGSPKDIIDIDKIPLTKINQVIIGGCTNGRLEDFKVVAEVLKGKKIDKDVTLIIVPASRNVINDMDRLGISEIIRNSGGIIVNPGCGPCSGIHQGVLASGDVAITTTARNTFGRMGSKDAKIYLSSPKIAAMSSLVGRLVKSK